MEIKSEIMDKANTINFEKERKKTLRKKSQERQAKNENDLWICQKANVCPVCGSHAKTKNSFIGKFIHCCDTYEITKCEDCGYKRGKEFYDSYLYH